MQTPRTLHLQATPSLGVRAWHNRSREAFGGCSAHPAIEIAWSLDGVIDYSVGARRMSLRPGSAVVVPAGVEHTTHVAAGTRARVLALCASVVEEVADAMNVRGTLRTSLTASPPRLLALGELVFLEATQQAPGHDLALDALTEALAVELLRVEPPRPASGKHARDPRIRRALDFIDTSFAGAVSLDAIAKVAGMSRFYFGRLFLAEVGMSPHRYLVEVRLTRAATLIRGGRVSVTEAALSVGFNDLGRFGRAFRSRFGVSPREALAESRPRRRLRREGAHRARSA